MGGAVGLLASFALTIEKMRLLADPAYVPTCSLNSVFSCGSVMSTPQAAVFGFPNPLLGIAGFAVVTTVGVAVLAGARLPRWFWVGLEAGVIFGVLFVHWLIAQSLYGIEALCPYCMVVWAVTMPLFWYTTLYTFRQRWSAPAQAMVVVVWYLLVAGLIVQAFWV